MRGHTSLHCPQFVTVQGSSGCNMSFEGEMGSFGVLSPVSVMEPIPSDSDRACKEPGGISSARGRREIFVFFCLFLKGMQIRAAAAIRLAAPGQLLWSSFSFTVGV